MVRLLSNMRLQTRLRRLSLARTGIQTAPLSLELAFMVSSPLLKKASTNDSVWSTLTCRTTRSINKRSKRFWCWFLRHKLYRRTLIFTWKILPWLSIRLKIAQTQITYAFLVKLLSAVTSSDHIKTLHLDVSQYASTQEFATEYILFSQQQPRV